MRALMWQSCRQRSEEELHVGPLTSAIALVHTTVILQHWADVTLKMPGQQVWVVGHNAHPDVVVLQLHECTYR
jgi:hypothetical protein